MIRWEGPTLEELRASAAAMAAMDAHNEEQDRLARQIAHELARPGRDVLDYLGIEVEGIAYDTGSIWSALEAHRLGIRV